MKKMTLATLITSNIIGSILILLFGYKSIKYFKIIKLKDLSYKDYENEIFNIFLLYFNFAPLAICLMIITSFFDFQKCDLKNMTSFDHNSEDNSLCGCLLSLVVTILAAIFIALFYLIMMSISFCCKTEGLRFFGFFFIMFINLITFISCFFSGKIYILYNIIEMVLSSILFFLNFYFLMCIELKICQKYSKNKGTITTQLIPNEKEGILPDNEVDNSIENKNLAYTKNNKDLSCSNEKVKIFTETIN